MPSEKKVDERLKPGALIQGYGTMYEVMRKIDGLVDVIDHRSGEWTQLKTWQALSCVLIRSAADSLAADAGQAPSDST